MTDIFLNSDYPQTHQNRIANPKKTKSPLTEWGFCLLLNQNLTKNPKIPD
jgi:hypothetical protein